MDWPTIRQCSQCGTMMSGELGICGKCGSSNSSSPVSGSLISSSTSFPELARQLRILSAWYVLSVVPVCVIIVTLLRLLPDPGSESWHAVLRDESRWYWVRWTGDALLYVNGLALFLQTAACCAALGVSYLKSALDMSGVALFTGGSSLFVFFAGHGSYAYPTTALLLYGGFLLFQTGLVTFCRRVGRLSASTDLLAHSVRALREWYLIVVKLALVVCLFSVAGQWFEQRPLIREVICWEFLLFVLYVIVHTSFVLTKTVGTLQVMAAVASLGSTATSTA